MSNFAVFACGWKSLIRSQPKKQYEKKTRRRGQIKIQNKQNKRPTRKANNSSETRAKLNAGCKTVETNKQRGQANRAQIRNWKINKKKGRKQK